MWHVLFDLRVALRAAGRQPVFTAVDVATLAVGIGASTATVRARLRSTLPAARLTRAVRDGVTATLALVALAASARPAWRAARVDPSSALRGE